MVVHLGKSIPIADPAANAGVVMGVNYGLDKVRFPSPVKVESRIRARRSLVDAAGSNAPSLAGPGADAGSGVHRLASCRTPKRWARGPTAG